MTSAKQRMVFNDEYGYVWVYRLLCFSKKKKTYVMYLHTLYGRDALFAAVRFFLMF